MFRALHDDQETKSPLRAQLRTAEDCGCFNVNHQTQHRAMVDQPAKLAQMISIMENSGIETVSVTNGSKQVRK